MRVAFIQFDIAWGNVEQNFSFIDKYLSNAQACDILVLPETYATGFNFQPDLTTIRQLKKIPDRQARLAEKYGCLIVGSNFFLGKEGRFNRLLYTLPGKESFVYDKRHLFTHANEHKVFSPGSAITSLMYNGWEITGFICYDLRFPVWTRNIQHLHLQIYVANWPEVRHRAWDILLRARAVENQCYVIGVNRIGTDMKGIKYKGGSMIIDPLGNVICSASDTEGVFYADLSMEQLLALRADFPVLDDADRFNIELD